MKPIRFTYVEDQATHRYVYVPMGYGQVIEKENLIVPVNETEFSNTPIPVDIVGNLIIFNEGKAWLFLSFIAIEIDDELLKKLDDTDLKDSNMNLLLLDKVYS